MISYGCGFSNQSAPGCGGDVPDASRLLMRELSGISESSGSRRGPMLARSVNWRWIHWSTSETTVVCTRWALSALHLHCSLSDHTKFSVALLTPDRDGRGRGLSRG